MAELFIAKDNVKSVFQLLGRHENDMTYSLGWTLYRSKSFLRKFLKDLGYTKKINPHLTIRLQKNEQTENVLLNKKNKNNRRKERGLTDIEIEDESNLFIIIEAKVGAGAVGWPQIEKYYSRIRKSNANYKIIVTLNENKEYAQQQLNKIKNEKKKELHKRIRPFIRSTTWKDINMAALSSIKGAPHESKRILRQFITYLRYAMRTSDINSNEVLVILKRELPGTKIKVTDFIKKHHAYLHPFGQTWPRIPSNYIAFTNDGRLGNIYWVKNVTTIKYPENKYKELPPTNEQAFLVYELGKEFSPKGVVRVGKFAWCRFVYCMLDTLFTSKTIADARKETELRLKS